MTAITTLGVDSLSLRGAGTEYNLFSRFFTTKAEADTALGNGSWAPTAGKTNACLTGDQGVMTYDFNTSALVNADSATRSYVDAAVQALIASAPGSLDTLNELAAALGDDANYAATVTAALAALQADVDGNETDADTAIAAVQADVDQNETDADAAIAAVQADVDQNETDSDAAEAALSGRITTLEADPTTAAAVAAVQADVDQNESDADTAIAAVQADVDQNEADADTAIAAVQADVDANETAAAALVTAENTAMLAAVAVVQADVDQNESDADTAIALRATIASPTFTGTPAAPTAATSTNTTQIATTAFVADAVANLISSSPGALDTLNELAAAIGDDANFSTTITNSIAAVQADADQNELDADAAIAAVQADVDANETAAAALVTAENTAMLAAVAVVQADVDQNETDADAAIAAVQADVNQNETDADAAIAAVQADVNQNETDSDAAEAALSARITTLEADPTTQTLLNAEIAARVATHLVSDAKIAVLEADPTTATAVAAVQADVDQNEADADTAIALRATIASPTFTGTPTAPTAGASTNTTQLATTAFVATAVGNLIDSSPGALNTLNELAAALGDDANFSTTVTTSIATVQADVDQNEVDADAAIAAVQADVNQNETDADAAIAAVQADVDQNESDADTAIALKADIASPTFTTKIESPEYHSAGSHLKFKADTNDIIFYPNNTETLQITRHSGTGHPNFTANGGSGEFKFNQITDLAGGVKLAGTTVTATAAEINAHEGRLDTLEADPTTATAVAAVQADVNQNETDADAAIAAVQADVDQNESDADTAIALKANKAGDTFTGDLVLRKSDGSAVSLVLSRADHADMNTEWKITPSYVSSTKECLSVLAAGQPVLHFDERQRVSINKTDPDYVLDVGGDGYFSTNLTVGGTANLSGGLTNAADDTAAAAAGVAVNQLYRNGSVVMIRVS